MFKKINQYLITHYPLVWNLKLVWIFAIGILINLVAFINGFLAFYHPSLLLEYNIFNLFFQDLYVVYYFFASLIILIIWLYYYFKNNRFKSNLPTSRNYLFKEFLGIFSVLFLFLCIPTVFSAGLKFRIANSISDEKFAKDVDLINTATPFTLDENYGYANSSRNLSVPVFDTLVTEEEVKLAMQQEIDSLNKIHNGDFETKMEKPYFRNEIFNDLLVDRLKNELDYDVDEFSNTYHAYDDSIIDSHLSKNILLDDETIAVVESYDDQKRFILYSLYNYSDIQFKVPNHPERNQKYYDEKLIDFLNRNDRKTIENVLNEYLKICDTYKVGYRFKTKKWIDHLPEPPYFQLKEELKNSDYHVNNKKIERDYVNGETVIEIYQRIEEAKFSPNYLKDLIYFLWSALVASVLIILFRWTSFKVWLISVVGSGILAMLLSCVYFLISLFFDSQFIGYFIPIVTYLIFIGVIYFGLKNNQYKLITGVVLNWFIASSLVIVLFILLSYKDYRYEVLSQENKNIDYFDISSLPEIEQLNQLIEAYFYYQPIVYLIFFYFIIQCFRKWRAMAEE